MKTHLRKAAAAAFLLTLPLAGCAGTANQGASQSASSAQDGPFRVGIEFTGAQNDGGYDEALYNGLVAAKESHGIEIQVAENKTSLADQTAAVSTLAQNNDLVVVVSFIGDAAKQIAQQYPNVQFFVVDGELDPAIPNLHSFRINQGEAAYVAGVVSADLTESNIVGFVGASEIPATIGSSEGFRLGIHSVAPDVDVLETYTGSFVDTTAAREAVTAQISQGADVIYTFLDSATDGAISAAAAAADRNVKIFNITRLRCDDGPFVAGADIISPTDFLSNLIAEAIDGKYPEGKPEVGLSNPDDQRLQMCPAFEQHQAKADEVTKGIVDGTVELPDSVI
ncbi:BMP family ABC transporter substrate-binding protein [Mycolicibacterium murale]|uniref:BMP family ABC transporter substrate-binding protein n=1 Tax=Mycolicibacterium murale TaxID=182220 RepID=A0A7I9WN30_9MYCO|nr:BMP family ABC transporter substrate-binding protein [Mycolicibacterium murale]MCV7180325.1 BMP family ABC transporter substrate-binding protein [Mycolicibacterium murale]GFG58740.1 BMP family ABC transporter substrate-binding protein [Mycolicibacterium murale]